MARRDQQPTSRFPGAPVVLAIGCTEEFADRCRDVAPMFGAVVQVCDLASAPTTAARLRPLAIVMTDDLYAFDPVEFDALAQDVGARLVRLAGEDIATEALELLIGSAVSESRRARRA